MTIFPYGCCFEYPHFELTEEVIHVNEEMIGRWERGEHNISARYRQLLCKLFGISDEEQSLLVSKDYNIWKEDTSPKDL